MRRNEEYELKSDCDECGVDEKERKTEARSMDNVNVVLREKN